MSEYKGSNVSRVSKGQHKQTSTQADRHMNERTDNWRSCVPTMETYVWRRNPSLRLEWLLLSLSSARYGVEAVCILGLICIPSWVSSQSNFVVIVNVLVCIVAVHILIYFSSRVASQSDCFVIVNVLVCIYILISSYPLNLFLGSLLSHSHE